MREEGVEEQNEDRQEEQQLSEETERLRQIGRGEQEPSSPSDADDDQSQGEDEERPEWLPENFKKPEDLAKAYAELRRKMSAGGAPKDGDEGDDDNNDEDDPKSPRIGDAKKKEADEGSDGDDNDDEDGNDDDEEETEFAPEAVTKTIAEVRDAYAETGEIGDEDRKKLNAVGFDDQTIDLYMEGVKAQENALRTKVFEIAGGEDEYVAATKWAAENWSPEEIADYDKALENPRMLSRIVKGLVSEYREANPSEGKLSERRGGGDRGSVFHSQDEFQQALEKAGDNPDQRRQVIDKLRRSRKAGTIKSRQQSPFGSF